MTRLFLTSRIVTLFLLWPTQVAHAAPGALSLSGDLGLGGLSGNVYATAQTGLDIREGNLGLGLFGKVRLAMQSIRGQGVVRQRDWDEASDYVHILRYMRYSRLFGVLQLQAAEGELLSFTLGHGTLLRDYSNIADPDHPHSGLHLRLSSERFSVDAMVDNFINPSVTALRAGVRPAAKAPALTLGASVVVDPRAPVRILRSASGQREVDSAYNLQAETRALALAGVDLEYVFGSPIKNQVVPYMDLNTSFSGIGFHTGARGRIRLNDRGAYLGLQLEYRASTGGYCPAYMETFYDVDRYQAGLSSAPAERMNPDHAGTKLATLDEERYGGQGVLAQAGLDLRRLLRFKVGFSHRPGPDGNTLWVRASSSPFERLNLGALVMLRGLGEESATSNGVMALAEGRFRITNNLYSLAQYTRTWSLEEGSRYFGILQSFNIALGATWSG